jgi:hypothetical protein
VAGATVTITTMHGEVVGAAITGSDGEFVCRGVPSDTYTVVAVAEGMHPSAGTLAVPETGVVRYDAELEPMATLTGVVEAGGRAVPDAQVTVLDTSGELIGIARTDDNGRYLVTDLPGGNHVVVTRGYPSVTTSVMVADGANVHDVELGYDPHCGIDSQPAYGGADVGSH